MIREVGFIVEYGYDFLTANVMDLLKQRLLIKNKLIIEKSNIVGILNWSNREKNLYIKFIENNYFFKETFENLYNNSELANEKKLQILKELNSFNTYLNIYPYNKYEVLKKEIFQIIIKNHLLLDTKKDLDLVKEGFKQFLEPALLINLLDDIKNNKTLSEEALFINQGNLARKSNNKTTSLIKLTAAILTIPAVNGATLPIFAYAATTLPNISITSQVAGVLGMMGSSFMAFYGIKKILENVHIAKENKKIKYLAVADYRKKDNSINILSFEFCNSFLHSQQEFREKYKLDVMIFCYLNEKLNYFNENDSEIKKVEMPSDLKSLISTQQIKRLKNLKFEEIQSFADIKNHEIRRHLILNYLNREDDMLLRIIDRNLDIEKLQSKKITKETIKLNPNIENFYNNYANDTEKVILKTYISLNSENGRILESSIDNLIVDGVLNKNKILQEMNRFYEIAYKNYTLEKDKTVLHKVLEGEFFNDTAKTIKVEELKKMNEETFLEIKKYATLHNMDKTISTINKVSSIIKEIIPIVASKARDTSKDVSNIINNVIPRLRIG